MWSQILVVVTDYCTVLLGAYIDNISCCLSGTISSTPLGFVSPFGCSSPFARTTVKYEHTIVRTRRKVHGLRFWLLCVLLRFLLLQMRCCYHINIIPLVVNKELEEYIFYLQDDYVCLFALSVYNLLRAEGCARSPPWTELCAENDPSTSKEGAVTMIILSIWYYHMILLFKCTTSGKKVSGMFERSAIWYYYMQVDEHEKGILSRSSSYTASKKFNHKKLHESTSGNLLCTLYYDMIWYNILRK